MNRDDIQPKARRAVPMRGAPVIPVVKTVMTKTKAAKSGVSLKKKDLVDRVAEASGVRKADARSVIDAALGMIAGALASGDEVVVPPLGKLRLTMEKSNGKVRVMTLRLQAMTEDDGGNEPLADAPD